MTKEPKFPKFAYENVSDHINTAVARYDKTYSTRPKSFAQAHWDEVQEKRAKLNALENPTREQVCEIVGNESWVTLTCNVCREEVVEVAVSTTKDNWRLAICETCLGELQDQLL